MNVKVNNQFLDFNDDIEIERQVKLFEEGGQSVGDFSYTFALQATTKNRSIFELYSIDQGDKIIYSKIPADLQNNGETFYSGYIVVEDDNDLEINCSFYSGNTNWLSLLDFPIRDADFSVHDLDWDLTTISSRETATTGILFPVINTGVMGSRSYVNWHRDDLHPFIYTKSVIQTLLNRNGIKLEGDILQDWRYNNMITSNAKASAPQGEIDDRSLRVNKSTTQTIITPTFAVITFPNTTGDYYPGDLWDTGTNTFTADADMTIDITVTLEVTLPASNTFGGTIFINGVMQTAPDGGSYILVFGSGAAETKTRTVRGIKLVSGDTLNFQGVSLTANVDVLSGTLTITPIRIYRVFTQYLMPDQTAKDFVTDVFSLFNPVINYNAASKVVTVNLFKNVIRKPEIDISKYVDTKTIKNDYTTLMKNYGRENYLLYSEGGSDSEKKYNSQNTIPYGGGVINSENQNAQGKADIFESNFIAVLEDSKNPFGTYLPSVEWRELGDGDKSDDGISITNSGGFLITATSGYALGDLIRVSNSTNQIYNGEYIISAMPSSNTFRLGGVIYAGNATADIERLTIEFSDSDEQVILLAIPNYGLTSFTNNSLMFYADTTGLTGVSSPATAYFYKPLQGLNIDDYKESLSFDPITIPNAFQTGLLDSYWRDFENIIRDPVLITAEANFPKSVFDSLFDGPLRLKTRKFNALFFMNGVTGYRASYLPCEMESIKL